MHMLQGKIKFTLKFFNLKVDSLLGLGDKGNWEIINLQFM